MLHFTAALRRERRQRRQRIADIGAAHHGGDFVKKLLQTLRD
ncbi:hypothetical protein [Dyella ginsengisoli]